MPGALDGIRVLELGRQVAAPYCAKLLADLGADCMKVERPEGDPLRRGSGAALTPQPPLPMLGEGVPDPTAVTQDSPSPGPLFPYLNANKRGIVLDLERSDDRTAFGRLIEQSDVFVTDLQPAAAAALGLTPETLVARSPHLVAASVTPFGWTGPRADAPSSELVDWAASGYAHLTPAGGKREGGRPLKPAGFQGGFMAGASAAAAVMAALHRRESSGRGQVVDVSIQETLICANDSTFARSMTHGDNIPTRNVASSFEFLPCKDGYVSLLFVREDQWERMVAMMGNPEWATTGLFASWADRRANWDAVAAMLSEYFLHYTREELYRTAQTHRIPLAPVNSAADVFHAPQLNARDYFVDLPLPNGGTVKAPGAPYRLAETPWSLRTDLTPRPPSLAGKGVPGRDTGASSDSGGTPIASRATAIWRGTPFPRREGGRGVRSASDCPLPLQDVRILDFTWVWAGPQACRFLADLGAETLKIESDRRIDNYRTTAAPDGSSYGLNRAPGFIVMNRNKRSVRINLGTPAGRELALRLAAVSDLVMENFAPRVMPGFGLRWEDFATVNPAIVMLSMSGFGGTGPDRDNVLYGNSQVALAGLGYASGFPDGPPENIGIAHGDPVAAYHAAYVAMAAIFRARGTGRGQHIDMSQWETMVATAPEPVLEYALTGREPQRRGNADPLMAPHGYYRCAGDDPAARGDGRWIAIAVADDTQWQALVAVMGAPPWSTRRDFATQKGRLAHAAELDALVESWTIIQDASTLERRLQSAGVPAAMVATIADIATDEHLTARGYFEEIDHPEAGRHRYLGVPFKLSESPARLHRHAPLFGGDAAYVLREVLGLSDREIAAYAAAGALH